MSVGDTIARLIPVEFLVPADASRWRPLVSDSLSFVFSHLSPARLASKFQEQAALPPSTAPEQRLIVLISRMPALQKIGQVLARNRRLSPDFRAALSQLENGMSDVTPAEIRALIEAGLGPRLREHDVKIASSILSEASVSAVVRFSWEDAGRERRHGVMKVLKPYVPAFFGEEMRLLQDLGAYLAAPARGYAYAIRDTQEMISEVRRILERELDFAGEQRTLLDARAAYQASIGIRVPEVIPQFCTPTITAMTEERGVKVTDAFRRFPARRARIARQLIEALVAVPLFSRDPVSVIHADPHAGNLFYDEPNRELIVLDWALAGRLEQPLRRNLILLVAGMTFGDCDGVIAAIEALRLPGSQGQGSIARHVRRYLERLPAAASPGALDAMHLLDEIALEGVRFPPALFLFRKILFTLDAVLQDVAGGDVRIDDVVVGDFLSRWLSSLGLFHAPLEWRDLAVLPCSAMILGSRRLALTGFGRALRDSTPSQKTKSQPPGKPRPPAPPRPRSRPGG